jgi:hypothetical protein
MIVVATRVERGSRGEDRIALHRQGDQLLIAVADGAGGMPGGARAAQAVCDGAVAAFRAGQPLRWAATLAAIDAQVHFGGQSTAVVVEVAAGALAGASVGDSGAWLIAAGAVVELTAGQPRKPLLGSGQASPVAFGPLALRGRLLVATDGLFKYAPRQRLAALAAAGALETRPPR